MNQNQAPQYDSPDAPRAGHTGPPQPGQAGQAGVPQHGYAAQPQPGYPGQPGPPQEPEKKRSWFARHKVLTMLGGLFVLAIVGAAASGGGDDPDAATLPAATVQATGGAGDADAADDPQGTGDTGTAEVTEVAEEPAEEPDDTPGVDDPVRDGDFEFVVTEVETGMTRVGSEFLNVTAQGQFVLVHMDISNIGSSAQTLFDGDQVLLDTEGRQHSADSTAGIYLEDNDVWISSVNPGNTLSGTIVFDIPADARPAQLELHDSMFSGGVTVDLG